MKSLLSTLLIATGTLGAAVSVLSGVQSVLRSPDRKRQPGLNAAEPAAIAEPVVAPVSPLAEAPVPKANTDRNFSIKRTKSEVGYVYWILEGYGKYKCFVLCDNWDEAVAQAKARMAEVDAAESSTQPAIKQPVPTNT